MVSSAATTVAQYLAELPAERRAVVAKVRAALRKAMPKGYEEAMGYGMICWQVPPRRFSGTRDGKPLVYVALAAQKGKYSLYLMGLYADGRQARELAAAYAAMGRKPDMGKGCVRFRGLDDLPLGVVAGLVASMSVEELIAARERRDGRG